MTLVTPLYMLAFGQGDLQGIGVIGALSLAVMLWSPVRNSVVDRVEYRQTRRLASDRSHLIRVVHALSHEVTTIAVTVPVLIWLGGMAGSRR